MGQIWQADGLGTSNDALEKIIETFKREGIKGDKSLNYLSMYIRKLSDEKIEEMYWKDQEATLQILVECFGVKKAFEKYLTVAIHDGRVTQKIGMVSKETYEEIAEKYNDRLKKMSEERERTYAEYTDALRKVDEYEEKYKQIQSIVMQYKADLYDFYAEKGCVPRYEY